MALNPKPSTLGYALLGLLARGNHSGYDLTQGLKDPVAFFWHAQHSQIYPELARLELAGLVQHRVIEQSERPDKKVYHLTPRGHEILVAWLDAPIPVPKTRDELVLKAYSIWLSNPQAASALIQSHAQAHAERLADFEQRLEKLKRLHGVEIARLDSPWFGVLAVLKRGIGYEREYLDWCNWILTCLSAKQ